VEYQTDVGGLLFSNKGIIHLHETSGTIGLVHLLMVVEQNTHLLKLVFYSLFSFKNSVFLMEKTMDLT